LSDLPPIQRPIQAGGLFEKQGFALIPNLVEPAVARFLSGHVKDCLEYGQFQYEAGRQIPSAYCDGAMNALLLRLLPRIETLTNRRLYPKPHRDRHACEISVSITLDFEAEHRWPLWVETHEGPKAHLKNNYYQVVASIS
jgi:hypothetical protein